MTKQVPTRHGILETVAASREEALGYSLGHDDVTELGRAAHFRQHLSGGLHFSVLHALQLALAHSVSEHDDVLWEDLVVLLVLRERRGDCSFQHMDLLFIVSECPRVVSGQSFIHRADEAHCGPAATVHTSVVHIHAKNLQSREFEVGDPGFATQLRIDLHDQFADHAHES